jgi:hypothetical protein
MFIFTIRPIFTIYWAGSKICPVFEGFDNASGFLRKTERVSFLSIFIEHFGYVLKKLKLDALHAL